tara:strand:+ start:822 stop:2096 length:1275 start_codon:yes stop_codon:yes gene_type:complete
MKILYLSHGDPDTDFSGVPLIAKQYINHFSKIGHECALLLPNIADQKKTNYENNKNKIRKFYWPTINEWRRKAFEKKPIEYKNTNSKIYFNPDIIHILDWVNFSPSILEKLKTFKVPIIRHLYNFEDYCYFTRPIYFYKNHEPCNAPLSTENCLKCIIKNEDVKITDKIKSLIFNKKNKLRKNLHNRKAIIEEHFDNYYDHLIFPSKSFADFFYDHYKKSKPYSVINHGIDRPKKKSENFDKSRINIIFCGGTELAKGWFVIESAFRKILGEGFTNFNLRIYGDKKFTSKSLLSSFKNINFFEKYNPNEIDQIFGWADIAIAPFFFETYSRIVREFMIRGVVPISTDAFGIPDVIDDNVNGFIINKPLETSLYNILKKILTDKNILDNAKKNIKNVTITSTEDELHDIFEIYQKLTGFSSNLKK